MYPEKRLKILITLYVFTVMLGSNSWAADVKTIDTAQLHSIIVDNAYRLEAGREKQFVVIDARTKEEYNESHIFSAVNIAEAYFERLESLLPKDKGVLIVVYDNDINSGTSTRWAGKAATVGYTNVVIYLDGFPVWKEKHMPIAPLKEHF